MPINEPIQYAVVDAKGAVLRIGKCDPAALNMQAAPGELLVLQPGPISDDTHYWSGADFVEYPPCPGEWAEFDFSTLTWVDPRTQADLDAEFEARRRAASLTKSQFIISAMSVGLLSPAEAAEAAKGLIPATFQAAFDGLTPQQQDYALVLWPAATIIERMDPLVLAVAQYLSISDQTMDAMCGLTPFHP